MSKVLKSLFCLILIFGLSIMNVTPAMANGQPDLQPTQITVPTLYAGLTNVVTVVVANNENVAVADFDVKLESDNGTGYIEVDTQTGNSILGSLEGGYADVEVSFDWTPSVAGDYTLRATVDSASAIAETDEDNNQTTQVVEVNITVTVRVEGQTSTIWSGEVSFATSAMTDEEGTTHYIDHPTALGALDAAATAGGFSYVVKSSLYVKEVAGEAEDTTDKVHWPGWLHRVNWVSAWVAAADNDLSDGDEVLWYYGGLDPVTFNPTPPLKLTVDNTSFPSTDNLTATVEYYDDTTTNFEPLEGATLYADSRIYATDASGQVNVSLPPGAYTVYADKGDYLEYTRSNSEAIVVYATLTLHLGWNFISIPKKLNSGNCTASEVFAGVDTDGHSIFQYTSVTSSGGSGGGGVGGGGGGGGTPGSGWSAMSSDTIVSPLEGIWIYSTSVKELHPMFDPDPRQVPPTKQLSAGWNAIGFSDFTEAPANSTLTSVESKWATLLGYDSENQVYESSIINNDTTGGSHDESREMYPWKGYWLYMTSAGELAGIGS
jgi:hypothetical protein